jgi:hypothetical protein
LHSNGRPAPVTARCDGPALGGDRLGPGLSGRGQQPGNLRVRARLRGRARGQPGLVGAGRVGAGGHQQPHGGGLLRQHRVQQRGATGRIGCVDACRGIGQQRLQGLDIAAIGGRLQRHRRRLPPGRGKRRLGRIEPGRRGIAHLDAPDAGTGDLDARRPGLGRGGLRLGHGRRPRFRRLRRHRDRRRCRPEGQANGRCGRCRRRRGPPRLGARVGRRGRPGRAVGGLGLRDDHVPVLVVRRQPGRGDVGRRSASHRVVDDRRRRHVGRRRGGQGRQREVPGERDGWRLRRLQRRRGDLHAAVGAVVRVEAPDPERHQQRGAGGRARAHAPGRQVDGHRAPASDRRHGRRDWRQRRRRRPLRRHLLRGGQHVGAHRRRRAAALVGEFVRPRVGRVEIGVAIRLLRPGCVHDALHPASSVRSLALA